MQRAVISSSGIQSAIMLLTGSPLLKDAGLPGAFALQWQSAISTTGKTTRAAVPTSLMTSMTFNPPCIGSKISGTVSPIGPQTKDTFSPLTAGDHPVAPATKAATGQARQEETAGLAYAAPTGNASVANPTLALADLLDAKVPEKLKEQSVLPGISVGQKSDSKVPAVGITQVDAALGIETHQSRTAIAGATLSIIAAASQGGFDGIAVDESKGHAELPQVFAGQEFDSKLVAAGSTPLSGAVDTKPQQSKAPIGSASVFSASFISSNRPDATLAEKSRGQSNLPVVPIRLECDLKPAAAGSTPCAVEVDTRLQPSEAPTADAATSVASLPLLSGLGEAVKEPNVQANLPQIQVGQASRQKRDVKPVAAGSKSSGAILNTELHQSDAALNLPQELVGAAGQGGLIGMQPRYQAQLPANLSSAAPAKQSPSAVGPRTSAKPFTIQPAVAGAEPSATVSHASPSPVELGIKHSVHSADAMPTPATHAAISSTSLTPTAIAHSISSALGETGSRAALATFSAPLMAPPSALVDHAAIAQAAGIGDQQIVASGPSHLDVGVFDGTHGWLRIRAELDPAGAVNASLTANASAHVSLKSALPEMTNYLLSEAVGVSKIAVHRFDAATSTTAGQSNGSAAGFGRGSQSGQESDTHKQSLVGTGNYDQQGEPTTPGALWPAGFSSGMSGGWLNVCA